MFSWTRGVKLLAVSFLILDVCLSWTGVRFSHSRLEDAEEGGVLFATKVWSSPETAAIEIVQILGNDPDGLFDLLSIDFRQAFGEVALQESIQAANLKIISVELISPPELLDENWAEFDLRLALQNGTSTDFKVILKNENGLWKIFGTQEDPSM